MKQNDLLLLIGSIILCQLAGIIGSVFTIPSIPSWYAFLVKPFFNPPNWLFSPVWTLLFLLMGISLYLILKKGFEKKEVKFAVSVFFVQLVLNVFWSFLFFGLKNPLFALIEILVLWTVILASILFFYRIEKKD